MTSRLEPCKSQPRPILKKKQQNFESKQQPKQPLFFSGNETTLNTLDTTFELEQTTDPNNRPLNSSSTATLSPTAVSSSSSTSSPVNNLTTSSSNECSSTSSGGSTGGAGRAYKHLKFNQDEERFKVSNLNQKLRHINLHSQFKKKSKHLSAIYVFHSREINKEIIKMLIKSTDGFLRDFKKDFLAENYSDIELMTVFRAEFVVRLKEFLLSSDNASSYFKDTGFAGGKHNIGFTLSEPTMSDVETVRRNIEKENQSMAHSKTTSNLAHFYDTYDHNELLGGDSGLSEPVEPPESFYSEVAGSLPNNSYFDSFEKELSLRESVLLKAYRAKSIENDEENMKMVKLAQATPKRISKDKSSNIISTATTTKKIVRFADAFGLDLEKVKIITNNSFVDAFSQNYRETNDDDELNSSDTSMEASATNASQPFLVLIPLFNLKKQDSMIRLEDYYYDYENKIIKCMLKLKSLSFYKEVFARITKNNWKSHQDLNAIYVKSEQGNNGTNYDYFVFFIVIPDRSNSNANTTATPPKSEETTTTTTTKQPSALDDCILRIEFALCCKQNGASYWDNNYGDNYKFQCFFNKTN